MSRASNGTYTAPANSFNPAVEGTAIDETDWNAILDDIETALTDSLSVSGKGKVTAHIDFDENGSPGTPSSNVGRLYAGDDSGLTTVYWKDSSGNTYNLLQGAASGLTYQFDTSTTTTSDPGAGKVRFNNATLASVTEIAIDDNTAAGADVSAFILTWDDAASSIKGTVFVQKRTSPSTIAIFNITGSSTDESGWTRLAVTYVTHNGSFSASDPVSVAFAAAGTGTNGATGATGPNAGLDYAFNTATSGDPGSGKLLFNSATIASVSQVNISETGRNSEALAAVIATWDDSTNTAHYGHLRIFDVADRTKFIELEITGTITDAGSYRTIPVTYTAGGTLPSNNAVLAVMFERTGNRGNDGTATAAGSDKQMQYNNAGTMAGTSGLSWDSTARRISLTPSSADTDPPTFHLSVQSVSLSQGPVSEPNYFNHVLHVGPNYNGGRIDTSKPGFGISFENKYHEGSAGEFFHEWHLQGESAAGTTWRAIYTLIPQDGDLTPASGTNPATMTLRFGIIDLQNNSGSYCQFNAATKLIELRQSTQLSGLVNNVPIARQINVAGSTYLNLPYWGTLGTANELIVTGPVWVSGTTSSTYGDAFVIQTTMAADKGALYLLSTSSVTGSHSMLRTEGSASAENRITHRNTNATSSTANGVIQALSTNHTNNATTGGDAVFRATVWDAYTGAAISDWSFGNDNSDDDAFVVSQGTALGTNNAMRIDRTTRVANFPSGLQLNGATVQAAGVQEWFIPASAFAPRTSNGCAALATLETTTNKINLPYLAFDATTQEFAQCIIPRMPKSWNESTITAVPQWLHPSTSTNFGVVWGVSAVALSDDDAADTAFGTAQTSADTGGTTNDIYHGPATSAITIGNSPAEGDTVVIQVSRNPSDASDTMAVDAYFLGLLIRVTTNAANDA